MYQTRIVELPFCWPLLRKHYSLFISLLMLGQARPNIWTQNQGGRHLGHSKGLACIAGNSNNGNFVEIAVKVFADHDWIISSDSVLGRKSPMSSNATWLKRLLMDYRKQIKLNSLWDKQCGYCTSCLLNCTLNWTGIDKQACEFWDILQTTASHPL